MTAPKIIILLSHIPILLAAVYALYCYKSLGRELKVFAWFIFFSGFIQTGSLALWFLRRNNMPLLHLYVGVGFVLLAWFYTTLLHKFMPVKIIWLTAILFLLYAIVNTFFFQDIFTFCSYALTTESVLIIILAIFTFTVFLNRIVKASLWDDSKSINWINAGLFIYYSSTLLISFFGTAIVHRIQGKIALYTWVLHSFFSVIMYSCFIISLWKRSGKPVL